MLGGGGRGQERLGSGEPAIDLHLIKGEYM